MSNWVHGRLRLKRSYRVYLTREKKHKKAPKQHAAIEFDGKWRVTEEKAMKDVKISWKHEYMEGKKGKD
jgi:collagenase-like PrtC family protease